MLTKGKIAIVDDEDYERVSQHKWCASEARNGRWYAVTRLPRTITHIPGRKIYLHRFLVGDDVDRIDHRNDDGLDCRRQNLRIATRSQNGMNRGKQRDNTSGFKGVVKHRSQRGVRDRWIAQTKVSGRRIYIGVYDTPEEAAAAYDAAIVNLHKDFAKPNFQRQSQ